MEWVGVVVGAVVGAVVVAGDTGRELVGRVISHFGKFYFYVGKFLFPFWQFQDGEDQGISRRAVAYDLVNISHFPFLFTKTYLDFYCLSCLVGVGWPGPSPLLAK